jgi:hypothetical protein
MSTTNIDIALTTQLFSHNDHIPTREKPELTDVEAEANAPKLSKKEVRIFAKVVH